MDAEFVKSKSFEKPLVYGLLLSSQRSCSISQELLDKTAILTGIQMNFMLPCFPDNQLIFKAELINKSKTNHAIEFKYRISRDEKILCHGMANVIWRP